MVFWLSVFGSRCIGGGGVREKAAKAALKFDISRLCPQIFIYKSLDQLVSSIFLFQLKLDSLPGHNFFIDFDWLSCAMQ